jgi:hypothetical protein
MVRKPSSDAKHELKECAFFHRLRLRILTTGIVELPQIYYHTNMAFNIDTDIDTVSEKWLKGFVHRMEKENGIFAGLDEGNRVIKLSPTMVVKCGYGVTAQEAAAQAFAYQHLDSSIVRIPRVHRFFHDGPHAFGSWGYLFMEYIEGWSLDDLDLQVYTDLIPRIAIIIAHMESMISEIPGPPGGGRPEGYLWSDEGARTEFHSAEELNTWLNKRLSTQNTSIDITSEKLVFCHMDLCRRNMIMLPDRTICLLDFGFAGFYPRCFEVVTLDFLTTEDVGYTSQLRQRLIEELEFTDKEKEYLALLHRVRAIQARFPSAL